jgi:hypothetical protein
MVVLDFLDPPGTAAQIKATDAEGVILYTKAVTRQFYKDCVAAGLGVALNFELKETTWRAGRVRGREHGAHARDVAGSVGTQETGRSSRATTSTSAPRPTSTSRSTTSAASTTAQAASRRAHTRSDRCWNE